MVVGMDVGGQRRIDRQQKQAAPPPVVMIR
jgi:hypothetical protein